MNREAYEKGLEVRREVLGADHVDRSVEGASAFDKDLQEMICGFAWGELWDRPGLERRERSLVIIAMLAATAPSTELKAHVIGAIRNGCTPEQIREVLLHAAVYLGFPSAIAAFRIARSAIEEIEADPSILDRV